MCDRLLVDRPKVRLWWTWRLPTALIEEGDGQKNRRLASFPLGFLNGASEKRAVCAQMCAQTGVPKTRSQLTIQNTLVVAFSVEGDGLNGDRLHRFAVESVPCKCLRHVYLQTRGEVAERLKAAVC